MAEADLDDAQEMYGKGDAQKRGGAIQNEYDDDEFGCEEEEPMKTFNIACEHIKTVVHTLSPIQLLEFYAFYKQATVGPCMIPRPSWYAFEAKQKWDAWNKLGKMNKNDAMNNYIELSRKIAAIKENKTMGGSKGLKSGWVAVSSMANDDADLNDEDKTIFDRVKENDLIKIKQLIRGRDVSSKDSDGMGLIHWAADRGNLDIIKFLIDDMNADIEMCDADGQTALHYAASCGHREVLKFLIGKGANKNAADSDGALPKDVAADKDIESILS